MARPREELQAILEGIEGVNAAYFQPDQNSQLDYPVIVYDRDDSYVSRADNIVYWLKKRYSVKVIDRNPDSLIPDKVEELPFTRFDRKYVAAGLHHTVFNVFF